MKQAVGDKIISGTSGLQKEGVNVEGSQDFWIIL